MDDCKSPRRCQMLGVTADGVFLYVEAGTTTQVVPMGDCKSFRSYQMLGSISDGVFFIRRGNDNDADDSLWTIFQILGTWSTH